MPTFSGLRENQSGDHPVTICAEWSTSSTQNLEPERSARSETAVHLTLSRRKVTAMFPLIVALAACRIKAQRKVLLSREIPRILPGPNFPRAALLAAGQDPSWKNAASAADEAAAVKLAKKAAADDEVPVNRGTAVDVTADEEGGRQ
jgi:hypothetical protein